MSLKGKWNRQEHIKFQKWDNLTLIFFWRERMTSARCLELGRNLPLRLSYVFWSTLLCQCHRWSILLGYLYCNFYILSVKCDCKGIMAGGKKSTSWNTMSSSVSKPLIRLEICINIFLNKVHGMQNNVKILLKSFLHGQRVFFYLVLSFCFFAWYCWKICF